MLLFNTRSNSGPYTAYKPGDGLGAGKRATVKKGNGMRKVNWAEREIGAPTSKFFFVGIKTLRASAPYRLTLRLNI